MTGIGFIGGGAILKHDDYVTGTASAARVWATGAIGAAVAYGFWQFALVLTAVNFLIVVVMTPLKPEEQQ